MNKKISVVYYNYSKEINENNKLFMRNFFSFNDKKQLWILNLIIYLSDYKTVNNYQHRFKKFINTCKLRMLLIIVNLTEVIIII